MTFPVNHLPPLNGNEIDIHIFWMQQALVLAQEAAIVGEVPVGAVLILDNQLITQAYNQNIKRCDPTAHAEILVLRQAAEKIGNHRLLNTSLYVTLEPCVMCAGALVHARINHLFFGAYDKKAGAIISHAQLFQQSFLNHTVKFQGGILQSKCGGILTQFFKDKRKKIKNWKTFNISLIK